MHVLGYARNNLHVDAHTASLFHK